MTDEAAAERELIATWLEGQNLAWAAKKVRALSHRGPRLTADERNRLIYERVRNGEKQKDVAKDYGMSPSRIGPIYDRERNRQWAEKRRRRRELGLLVTAGFSELWIV